MGTDLNSFESKLLAGFGSAVKAGKLGIGVSGGADSIALLTGTCRLIKENRLSAQNIFVITVNHYIRPENETCGDAAFVVDYCNQLKLQGLPVTVELCELGKGEVQKILDYNFNQKHVRGGESTRKKYQKTSLS